MAGAPLAEMGSAMGLDDRLTAKVDELEDLEMKQLVEKPTEWQLQRMQDKAMEVAEKYWKEVAPEQQ